MFLFLFIWHSLELQRRLIQTKVYRKIFYIVWKKRFTNFQEKQLQIFFSADCVLWVQFALGFFYRYRLLKKIVFNKNLRLLWGYFHSSCSMLSGRKASNWMLIRKFHYKATEYLLYLIKLIFFTHSIAIWASV